MKKNKTRVYWRKKACTLAKKIARMKANYKCAYCGQGEPNRQTHGSHIYSEGTYRNMSADVDNILCLCATHHMAASPWNKASNWSWHGTPEQSWPWFVSNYPELHKTLRKRSQDTMRIVDFEKKYKELKEEYNELEGRTN